jgi:Zn-dependent protease
MRWSLRLGRVNGAPVEVHWLFAPLLAWAAFVGWTESGAFGLLYTTGLLLATFACILLHEVGHTVQAQALSIPVRRIVLLPFGGLAHLARLPDKPADELRVAVAGPLVNLGLALIMAPLLIVWLLASGGALPSWPRLLFDVTRGMPGALHFFESLTFVNAGLLVLNVLPAFPLDGGRMARSALALFLPRDTATHFIARLGWLLGAAALLLATVAARSWGQPVALSLLVTGITMVLGAGAEEAFERGQAALKGIPVRSAVRQPTWYLQPAQVLTPALLSAIKALNRPALPVVGEAGVVGVINRRDLARVRPGSLDGAATVASRMRSDFARVEADADLWRAQLIMLDAGQEALPVLDGERLLGMLTSADIRAAAVAPPLPGGAAAPQLVSPESSSL